MWVIKLGGSLIHDDRLLPWLKLVEQLGGGRVTLVCGGGSLAREVHKLQQRWGFADLPAHNMAVLAMAQFAYMAQGLAPGLQLAMTPTDIQRVLHRGQAALWLPLQWLREHPEADTSWEVTSDALALHLARQLNAERLVVVKSCALDAGAALGELARQGVLDRRFPQWAAHAAFPIDIVHRDETERVREALMRPAHGVPAAGALSFERGRRGG